MGKTVKSTIKRFPGSVIFYEPLTFPMVIAFENAITESRKLRKEGASQSAYEYALLPAICDCIEEWHLEGQGDLTPDTFPVMPRRASAELIWFFVNEIMKMYSEDEEESPNE